MGDLNYLEMNGQGVQESEILDFSQDHKGSRKVEIESWPRKSHKWLKLFLSLLAVLVIFSLLVAILLIVANI